MHWRPRKKTNPQKEEKFLGGETREFWNKEIVIMEFELMEALLIETVSKNCAQPITNIILQHFFPNYPFSL